MGSAENKRNWYLQNRSKTIERSRLWRLNNPIRDKELKKLSYEKRKHEILTIEQRRLQKVRRELMKLLGGEECVHCGYSTYQALQFDHIHGGGRKDREYFKSGRLMYQFYLQNPDIAKTTLQVLCANCNFIKRSKERGELN